MSQLFMEMVGRYVEPETQCRDEDVVIQMGRGIKRAGITNKPEVPASGTSN